MNNKENYFLAWVVLMCPFFPSFLSKANGLPELHKEMFNDSFEHILKLLVPFLSDRKDWKAASPLLLKSSDENYVIAIFQHS